MNDWEDQLSHRGNRQFTKIGDLFTEHSCMECVLVDRDVSLLSRALLTFPVILLIAKEYIYFPTPSPLPPFPVQKTPSTAELWKTGA